MRLWVAGPGFEPGETVVGDFTDHDRCGCCVGDYLGKHARPGCGVTRLSHVYPAPGCYHADFPCRAGFTAHCGPTATSTARPWPEAMTFAPVPSRLASTIVPA